MLVGDRLKKVIDHFQYNPLEFSKMLGFERADKIYNILNGKFNPSFEILLAITNKFVEINIEWLITGESEMLRKTNSIEVKKERMSPKEPVFTAHEVKSITDQQQCIPLIGLDVAAGFGTTDFAITESDIQSLYVVPDFENIDFMIRVKGSSMYPKYSSGDIIACRKLKDSKFIQWNKCYVIATIEQGLLIKRIRQCDKTDFLLAVSDNKEYQPFEIPKNEITGIALVIGVIRLE